MMRSCSLLTYLLFIASSLFVVDGFSGFSWSSPHLILPRSSHGSISHGSISHVTTSSLSSTSPDTAPLPLPVASRRPKVVYFTGAGVYFFWQVGCAKYLQESCFSAPREVEGGGPGTPVVPVIGASAGSLTGLMLLCGVDIDNAVEVALRQASEREIWSKKNGLRGELTTLLADWMEEVLPKEIPPEVLNQLSVALTPPPINPFKISPPTLEMGFANRQEVIEACQASCHIPWFSSGTPVAKYKDRGYIDGSFFYWVTKNRFTGLPLPDMDVDDILWVDYGDDPDFMEEIKDKSFLGVHSKEAVKSMVQAGYDFMKRAHANGELPLAVTPKPAIEVPLSSVRERGRGRGGGGASRLEVERALWMREKQSKEEATNIAQEAEKMTRQHNSKTARIATAAGLTGGVNDVMYFSMYDLDMDAAEQDEG